MIASSKNVQRTTNSWFFTFLQKTKTKTKTNRNWMICLFANSTSKWGGEKQSKTKVTTPSFNRFFSFHSFLSFLSWTLFERFSNVYQVVNAISSQKLHDLTVLSFTVGRVIFLKFSFSFSHFSISVRRYLKTSFLPLESLDEDFVNGTLNCFGRVANVENNNFENSEKYRQMA